MNKRSNHVREAYARGYRVDENGTITNPDGIQVGYMNNSGYCDISIKINGKNKTFQRAHLQAFQKFGDAMYEPGIVVRHLNGNPQDDSAANIAIGTHSDNMMDIPKEKRIEKSRAANKRYDDGLISRMLACGMNYRQIMGAMGIPSKGTLSYIVRKILNTESRKTSFASQP